MNAFRPEDGGFDVLRHPGLVSDLFASPLDTVFRRVEGGLVATCPSRPDYWFGNLLCLAEPVIPDRWDAVADQCCAELAAAPGVQRWSFKWEGPPNVRDPWGSDPRIEWVQIHRLGTLVAPTDPYPGTVARVSLDQWDLLVAMHKRAWAGGAWGETTWMMDTFQRSRVEAGLTTWWAMWNGDRLVGSCGLTRAPGFARFQEICTDPDVRRQGVCTTLVHHVARQCEGEGPLLMAAESGSGAERVYRSVGFEPITIQGCVALPIK